MIPFTPGGEPRMTLDERIAALTEAEAKMTPGMWRWNATAGCSQDYYEGPLDSLVSSDDEPVCDFGDCTQYYPSSGTPPSGSDMAGIVALRNDALPIIAELRAERDAAEATLRDDGWALIERNCYGERIWKPPVRNTALAGLLTDAHQQLATARAERDELIAAAKHGIPYAETPKEPSAENWAWQIRMMGEDRRAAYRSLSRAEANAAKWESAAATHCARANKAEAERDRLAERCERMRETLQSTLADNDGVEIKTCNYNQADVCNLNNAYCNLFGAIESALAEKGTTDGN